MKNKKITIIQWINKCKDKKMNIKLNRKIQEI